MCVCVCVCVCAVVVVVVLNMHTDLSVFHAHKTHLELFCYYHVLSVCFHILAVENFLSIKDGLFLFVCLVLGAFLFCFVFLLLLF